MIKIYSRPKDKVQLMDLDILRRKNVSIVDVYKPTEKELKELSEVTKISLSDFHEHITEYERPNTFEFETYSLIVFGAPVETKSHKTKISSLAIFLLNNNNILLVRTQEMNCVHNLINDLLEKNPKYFSYQTKTVRVLLEKIVNDYFEYLDVFEGKAEKIESHIFHNPSEEAVENVFRLKKKLLFFHKALLANREVVVAIEKEYVKKISRSELYEFKDLYNDIVQLIDTEETLRDILTGVMNIYMSSVSNKMNAAMKKLTVVASYVLIPTLIASIYGMNFKFMPEVNWTYGYPFAIGLMILSVLAMYVYFKRAKWI